MHLRTNALSPGRSIDYEALKRNAYHDQGIAIIDLTDSRIPWPIRELLQQECQRIYGKRDSKAA